MNRYGEAARDHWMRTSPDQVTKLQNTEEFFDRLGEDIWTEIQRLKDELAGAAPPGEKDLERLARLQTARATAEDEVMRRMVYLAELRLDEDPDNP